jgi:hypothetical protein
MWLTGTAAFQICQGHHVQMPVVACKPTCRDARDPATSHHFVMFKGHRASWQKARRQRASRFGVNILAKLWIRSKQLRALKRRLLIMFFARTTTYIDSVSYLRRSLESRSPQYKALRDGQIRLLHLKPGYSMNTIECDFSYAELGSPGDYSALSYTWGRDPPSIPILMNGKATLVTENLYLALLHFRERGIKTLWVDYLCINQNDLLERASQVSLMKDVYSKADMVLIWLGESNALTERAFDEFHGLVELLDYQNIIPSNYINNPTTQHPERWRAISEILYRPWFRRMWIIQEVLSARRGMVVCGKDILDLGLFLNIINSMFRADALNVIFSHHPNRHELLDGPMRVALEQICFLVKAKFSTVNIFMQWKFKPTLLNYLAETRWAEATDPRDKVYGILGLAHTARPLGHWCKTGEKGPEWIPFTVSYITPASDVFVSVTRAIIDSTRSLDILRFAQYTSNQVEGLPSWVPDWAKSKPHDVNGYLSITPMSTKTSEASWRPHKSSPLHDEITRRCPPHQCLRGSDILTVKGIHIDTITSISPHAHPEDFSMFTSDPRGPATQSYIDQKQNYLDALTDWIHDCVNQAMTWCSPYPSSHETTWTSLWALLNGISGDPNARIPDSPEDMLEDFHNANNSFAAIKSHLLSEQFGPKDALLEVAANVAVHYFGTCISRLPKSSMACQGRKFAATQGRFMGLVPEQAEVGDWVCAVYGIEMPLILRKCEHEEFRLIGHGRLEGLRFDKAVVEETFRGSYKGVKKKVKKASFRTFEDNGQSVYTILKETRLFDLI